MPPLQQQAAVVYSWLCRAVVWEALLRCCACQRHLVLRTHPFTMLKPRSRSAHGIDRMLRCGQRGEATHAAAAVKWPPASSLHDVARGTMVLLLRRRGVPTHHRSKKLLKSRFCFTSAALERCLLAASSVATSFSNELSRDVTLRMACGAWHHVVHAYGQWKDSAAHASVPMQIAVQWSSVHEHAER